MFNENEQQLLKETLNLSGVGRLFGVSDTYVRQIIKGQRGVQSPLARKIENYLRRQIEVQPNKEAS